MPNFVALRFPTFGRETTGRAGRWRDTPSDVLKTGRSQRSAWCGLVHMADVVASQGALRCLPPVDAAVMVIDRVLAPDAVDVYVG